VNALIFDLKKNILRHLYIKKKRCDVDSKTILAHKLLGIITKIDTLGLIVHLWTTKQMLPMPLSLSTTQMIFCFRVLRGLKVRALNYGISPQWVMGDGCQTDADF
jgi:hypothetical protein